jgi:hypothetical protein
MPSVRNLERKINRNIIYLYNLNKLILPLVIKAPLPRYLF